MGSLGVVELIIIFGAIVGTPAVLVYMLISRRKSLNANAADNSVSIGELQAVTSRTLQDSLAPLENKLDKLSDRMDAIESRLSDGTRSD